MSETETIVIDAYPWAEPTEEQKAYFDSLPPEQRRKLIDQAIADALESGLSIKSVGDIAAEVDDELDK